MKTYIVVINFYCESMHLTRTYKANAKNKNTAECIACMCLGDSFGIVEIEEIHCNIDL